MPVGAELVDAPAHRSSNEAQRPSSAAGDAGRRGCILLGDFEAAYAASSISAAAVAINARAAATLERLDGASPAAVSSVPRPML